MAQKRSQKYFRKSSENGGRSWKIIEKWNWKTVVDVGKSLENCAKITKMFSLFCKYQNKINGTGHSGQRPSVFS